ncbi:MAG TPA: PIG-L family deacetylase [Bacteroidia bacterium]|jgi:LmbE family N-acetylglucosaminyl deacetylase|nr:PIG-L family deacetylase [Bacteroidia bacterium]
MKRLVFFIATIKLFSVPAQTSGTMNSSDILQSLEKLNTLGSVLYIAAHPDDENTRLLAYMSRERNLRTGYLSITRGDGGQNLIGKEQGEALGLIRTQELLAARRIDGAEQFFTRANDFGYSKNPEETFSFWNKDSVLADVVWAIRNFKPDVIICRFPTTGEGGHGHHTASAILALEAFDAAADPKRFSNQLAYTEVWQARRIFWNTFNFGGTNTTSPNQLQIDAGVYNPLLGKSYGEIAAESRSMHKSQGFGSGKARGQIIEYFKLLKGDSVKKDLFEGIDQGFKRFPAFVKIQSVLDDCIKKYDVASPQKSVSTLITVYKQLLQIDEADANIRYWKKQKMKETEVLILSCSGLWMEAYAGDYSAVPGNDVSTTVQIISRMSGEVKLNKLSFLNQTDTIPALNLKMNELYTFRHKEKLSATAPFSNPYWLNEEHSEGAYSVKNDLLIDKPENDPFAKVLFELSVQDLILKIERPLVYKYTDPVKGEVYRPFEILPPATVNSNDKVIVFTSAIPKKIQFAIKANSNNVTGSLQLNTPEGWAVTVDKPDFNLIAKNDEALIDVVITPGKNAANISLQPKLKIQSEFYEKSIKRIEYDHIPYQFILSKAEVKLVNIDLKIKNVQIAYIPGAGDDVPACLKQVGYDVTILNDELLVKEDLSKYQAIVTGVRAYNTNECLQVHYNKLMQYVKNGGNLIVQYNTNNRIGPVGTKLGPYPFTISRDRVTDENAEITFVNPQHPILNSPNKITNEDFKNWVQERGIYFASEPDKNYESIFSINDAGEKPLTGSLITAKYGKGNFVYTGLAFFRELPAGVVGAYRLFVNLLSIPQNK